MIKRNDTLNKNRKFKDLHVGDRIFIRNNIRTNKFVKKYTGPFRIEHIVGSMVFCYSLATGKKKQVSMEKCRYIADLKQEEAPEILLAYPENEPILDDENSLETQIHNPNSSTTMVSQDVRLSKQPGQQKVDTFNTATNRYFFRQRK